MQNITITSSDQYDEYRSYYLARFNDDSAIVIRHDPRDQSWETGLYEHWRTPHEKWRHLDGNYASGEAAAKSVAIDLTEDSSLPVEVTSVTSIEVELGDDGDEVSEPLGGAELLALADNTVVYGVTYDGTSQEYYRSYEAACAAAEEWVGDEHTWEHQSVEGTAKIYRAGRVLEGFECDGDRTASVGCDGIKVGTIKAEG